MFWFGLLHHFGFCMVQAIEIYSHDYITRVKGALDKFNIIPQLFQQKDGIFWTLIIFYYSESTSINTQNSSIWDTLKMMLFTKYLIKWKCIGRISWKFRHCLHLRFSIELDIDVILVQFLFNKLTIWSKSMSLYSSTVHYKLTKKNPHDSRVQDMHLAHPYLIFNAIKEF